MSTPDEFRQAGLYDPDDHTVKGRLELLNWLDELGFTTAEMLVALEGDHLGALAGDRRLVPAGRLARPQAIEAAGLTPERFDALATAFGMLPIGTDPSAEIELTAAEIDMLVRFDGVAKLFSPEEADSFVRVIGASIGRMAEAAVSLFLTDVESPLLMSGGSELDVAVSVHEAIGLLDGFAEGLDPLLRRHLLQSIRRSRRSVIDTQERFQYRYAIGFVDLVGFTEISGHMAPRELAGFIRDFEGRAHDVVTDHDARLVKLIGDEVMFVATDPSAACEAACGLMTAFGTADRAVTPRGGLAYGLVLVRGGDYYGSIVNLASRLVDEAVPNEMLVTVDLADAAVGCTFEPAGRRMVKGFPEPIAVRSLDPGSFHDVGR